MQYVECTCLECFCVSFMVSMLCFDTIFSHATCLGQCLRGMFKPSTSFIQFVFIYLQFCELCMWTFYVLNYTPEFSFFTCRCTLHIAVIHEYLIHCVFHMWHFDTENNTNCFLNRSNVVVGFTAV